MARLPRLAIAGLPHYALVRAIGSQPLFIDEVDCLHYLELLAAASAEAGVAVHAFALLPTDIALIGTPRAAAGVSTMLQSIARRYVRRFNDRHRRKGSLFEARYRAAVIQPDRHLLAAIVHLERLPVSSGLVEQPGDYRWSSYAHHAGHQPSPLIDDPTIYWQLGNTPFDRHAAFRHRLQQSALAHEDELIRRAVTGGWAIGDAEFLAGIGGARRVSPGCPGRPRRDVAPISSKQRRTE